jgi:hypothetical protein
MMDKDTKGKVIWAVVVVALALAVYFFINQPQSIISQSNNVQFTNGKLYTLTYLSINTNNQSVAYLAGGNYTYPNGTTITAKKVSQIVFGQGNQYCRYTLAEKSDPVIGAISLNLWKYYEIQSQSLTIPVDIWSNNNYEGTFDLAPVKNTKTVQDIDGKGFATIEADGVTAQSVCAPTSGLVVLNAHGVPHVVLKSDYITNRDNNLNLIAYTGNCAVTCAVSVITSSYAQCKVCLTGYVDTLAGYNMPEDPNFNSYYSIKQFDSGYTTLTGIVAGSKIANPKVLITADQDFFDSVLYSVPETTQPKIISFSNNQITEKTVGTYNVIIQNTGNIQDNYQWTVSSDYGTFASPSGTVMISAGSQLSLPLTFSAPYDSSTSDKTVNIVFKVCSNSQIPNSQKCDTWTIQRTIKNTDGQIIPPAPVCGDTHCDASIGENTQTCSQDCKANATTCTIQNAEIQSGVCTCKAGYTIGYDQNGSMTCTGGINLVQIAILGAIAVVAYLALKKSKVVK